MVLREMSVVSLPAGEPVNCQSVDEIGNAFISTMDVLEADSGNALLS